jgi:hypothetical protein
MTATRRFPAVAAVNDVPTEPLSATVPCASFLRVTVAFAGGTSTVCARHAREVFVNVPGFSDEAAERAFVATPSAHELVDEALFVSVAEV